MEILLKKQAKKIFAIDLDADINSLVYADISTAEIELLAWKVVDLFDMPAEEKEKYLLTAITNFLKENDISEREAYASINGPAVYFSRLMLPSIPSREIHGILNWQLKGKIPFPIEESVFDYDLIKETTEADKTQKTHFLIALALKKEIDKVCSLFAKLDLRPAKINLSPFCISSLLYALKDIDSQKTYAILEIGWQGSVFSFYQEKKLIFSRPILLGIVNFIHALQTSLVYAGNQIGLSSEQAHRVIKEVGLPQDLSGNWQGFPHSQIFVLMRPELEKLTVEFNRSLEYFASNVQPDSIEKIFVTGLGIEIEGIVKFLSQNLNINMEVLPINVKGTPPNLKDASCIASALGNALGREQKINLAPRQYQPTKTALIEKVLQFAIPAISAFLLVSLMFLTLRIHDYQKRVKFLQRQRQTINNLLNLNSKVKELKFARNALTKDDFRIDWIMKELSQLTSAHVIFTDLAIRRLDKTINITGIITDSAVPENTLISFMKAIEKSKLFKDATLNSVKKDIPNQAQFQLTFKLK